MNIKIKLCDGKEELEDFLNNKLEYGFYKPENIILGITQDRMYYTVIYKDLQNK